MKSRQEPTADSQPQRPRLLFINRSYWPDVEATGQLLTELCEDLAADFDVTVICGRARTVVEDVPPGAEQLDERRGVQIRRVRHTQFNKASFVGRLANMLTFQMAATWSALFAPRFDLVVVETDPPFLCLLGRLLQVLRRVPLVCYLQDIYPDVAVALGKLRPGLLARLLRSAFFHVYRRSDAVVVLSRDMQNLLIEGGVPAEQVHVIPNWIDTDLVHPIKDANRFRHLHGLDDRFVVMYSGNLGLSQNLTQVLEAAAHVRNCEQIVFAFIGSGADRPNLERIAREKGLTNVRFFDYQPKAELADSLSAADVHLVVLQPQIRRLLMPSKLYGALASGTPVLAITAGDCELAEIVEQHDLGRVVSNGQVAELADAVRTMSTSPATLHRQATNARQFAESHCTRAVSVARLQVLFSQSLQLRPDSSSNPAIATSPTNSATAVKCCVVQNS
ncbi:MAG: glycosyltransferase family 4 protein [Pirellulales bacterium]